MKKITLILVLFSVLLTSGFGCKLVDKKTQEAMQPITLTYWRVFDGPDAFDEIIANYKKIHPFVNINYRKLRYEEYEKELLDAMAEDRGPDIFSIHNTWVRKYKNKIKPMPSSITMAYPIIKGTLKKEVIPELRTTKSLTLKDISNNFVDVVYDDVVLKIKDEKSDGYKDLVYGLPLSVDTLAMFYNKDILNSAGVSEPPIYWNKDFLEAVKKMTKQDARGQIVQSGVSLGGSANIERSSDILALLMMQNGAEMIKENNMPNFHVVPGNFQSQNYNPGLEALRFYTDFAIPSKEVYTWNSTIDNSVKMFSEGRLAVTFGYSYHLPTIKAQSKKLNFSIAKIPQIEGNEKINFANYWVEAVSAKSKHTDEAWDFVQFATKAEQVENYLKKAKKPTALKSLINKQIDDVELGSFADQVLTAQSWYKGYDSAAVDVIFNETIDSIVAGREKIEQAALLAVRKIAQTMEEKKVSNEK